MCKKKAVCLKLELIKCEDGDDKAKWEHHLSYLSVSTVFRESASFHGLKKFLT